MPLKSYGDLIAWQKAMDLVQAVYETVRAFPKEEIYGLTGQLKRAAISVPSNIAEGQGRKSTREFIHHLSIAYGSLMRSRNTNTDRSKAWIFEPGRCSANHRTNGRGGSFNQRLIECSD